MARLKLLIYFPACLVVFAATGNTQALLPKNSPSLELTQNTLMNIKHKRVETSEPLAMVTVQKMTVCPS